MAALRTDNLRSVIPHEPAAPPDEDVGAALKRTVGEIIELVYKGENEQALTMVGSTFAKATQNELAELRSAPVWNAHVGGFHRTVLPAFDAAGEFDWRTLAPFEAVSTPTVLPVGGESPHRGLAHRLHELLSNSRLATVEGDGQFVHPVAPDRYTDEGLSVIDEGDEAIRFPHRSLRCTRAVRTVNAPSVEGWVLPRLPGPQRRSHPVAITTFG